jgi:hypothetical protein
MASSPPSRLTPLQQELLAAFCERESRFFLTGGAALAGFYFGHRTTEDLGLFAAPGPDLADAGRAVEERVASLGEAAIRRRLRIPGIVDRMIIAAAQEAGETVWALDGPLRRLARAVGVAGPA